MKKLFSSLLAAALVVGGINIPMTANAAEGTVAYLSYADNNWAVQYWDDGGDWSPTGFTKITFEITPTIYVCEPAEEEASGFDPSGTYHAAMGIQTCDTLWIMRSAYFCESLNEYYGTDLQALGVYEEDGSNE